MENEELITLVKDLLYYFDMAEGDYPSCSVYSQGAYYTGVVEDELQDTLEAIKEIIEEEHDGL